MAGRFYVALAGEQDPVRVLKIIREHLKPNQRVFVGVIDPIDPRIETAEEVCERVLQAADYIPLAQLGTCDDCGFAPFCDDTTTTRETAFAKIRARVEGTATRERTTERARNGTRQGRRGTAPHRRSAKRSEHSRRRDAAPRRRCASSRNGSASTLASIGDAVISTDAEVRDIM